MTKPKDPAIPQRSRARLARIEELQYLLEWGPVDRYEAANFLNISPRTAERYLGELHGKGLVEWRRTDGRYHRKESGPAENTAGEPQQAP